MFFGLSSLRYQVLLRGTVGILLPFRPASQQVKLESEHLGREQANYGHGETDGLEDHGDLLSKKAIAAARTISDFRRETDKITKLYE